MFHNQIRHPLVIILLLLFMKYPGKSQTWFVGDAQNKGEKEIIKYLKAPGRGYDGLGGV